MYLRHDHIEQITCDKCGIVVGGPRKLKEHKCMWVHNEGLS